MESQQLKNILEAALLAAGEPRTIDQLRALFGEDNPPEKQELKAVLQALQEEYSSRGIELREVASGYRVQVRDSMSHWLARLWEERPPRYSRALMETLAIIAYRQPVTRGDVEEIRGVVVTSNIIRTLLERNWIKVVGHRDVPGKPAMFGTTREFLDYFGLQKLDDLPPLAELAKLEPVSVQLDLGTADQENGNGSAGAAYLHVDSEIGQLGDAAGVVGMQHVQSQQSESLNIAATGDEEDDDEFDEDEDEDEDDDFDDDEDDDFDDQADDDDENAKTHADDLAVADSPDDAVETYSEEEDVEVGVPHSGATPLVRLHPQGAIVSKSASVASLDAARAAAVVRRTDDAEIENDADEGHSADVLPLQSS